MAGTSVSVTAGFEHSSSRMLQDSATPVGTALRSGGSTTIEAEQGSIHAVGARIAAGVDAQGRPTGEPGNVSLTAGQGILLESAQATIDRIFGARSMQAAAGFDLAGGPAGSASYARDTGQSHEVRQVDSQVSGTGTVSLTSGGDTSLRGATVTGGQIVASVGGDLTIESRFDTARYRESSLQAQGRFGGGSVSGGASRGSVRGDSANVAEQSGLIAGAGGYQLTVGGGVNLIGGLITSTADPSQNRLSADHLTFSDLLGSTRAISSSMGLSIGGTEKDGLGLPLPQVGMPVQQSSSGVARATLSPGTLELRNQGQDLSGLNRDASAANRQAQPYDIERLRARQRSVAALSELMNEGIGTLSKSLGLEDGSPAKTAFHAAAGALTALAAGGNVAGGALAGAASEMVGTVVMKALADNPNLTQAERNAPGQWAAVVGAVTAGEAGAATALDAERYNRQLHPRQHETSEALRRVDSKFADITASQPAGSFLDKLAEENAPLACPHSVARVRS
ncbi:filamentous hemagglutinin [Methylobacterium phyllostachyos]|uniref:Filamentous hemagglutinin n=1 Tax=Methylobacterium phyllostachyos TaxID=582672 RepID=A0A1H0L2D4_9HYPH|nr:hemagglutinin repeat-containing protein [Methylobacterium phyllostachyos]SDO62235.1 filamentous hemagglutinin [Methylobacterium phyllostachyos]